jgi:hypothetical protein
MIYQCLSFALWDTDINIAMQKLKTGTKESPTTSEKEFIKNSRDLWSILKENRKDWIGLLNQKLYVTDLVRFRDILSQKKYINKVFTTKPATLVLEMTKNPNIIVKIDNRSAYNFDEVYRSYLAAMEKAKEVQNSAAPGELSLLYLPYETGRDSKEAGVKVVFSQKAPLFSTEEIDNAALLLMMLSNAENDPQLGLELKRMLAQALTYICRVDFDDINHRNIPFATDGRLVPFDTDTGLAITGIENFSKLFFVPSILNKDEVKEIVKNNCTKYKKKTLLKVDKLYSDQAQEKARLAENKNALNKILNFINKNKDMKPLAPKIDDKMKKKIALIIDKIMSEKKYGSNKETLSARCDKADGIISDSAFELEKLEGIPLSEAADMAEKVLQKGIDIGTIHSFVSLKEAKEYNDMRSYLCF